MVAYATPLYHGVALCRDLTLGQVGWADLGHAAYLLRARRRGLSRGPADLRQAAGGLSTMTTTSPVRRRASTSGRPRWRPHHAARPPRRAATRSRVLERNILVYRRSWIFIVSGFFEPLFYLLSIGVGLSHLVGPINVDGREIPYTAFVAPGLLASSAMNGAMLDSTFLVFFKLKIAKTYDAMLSTPLGVSDVALGELSWCVLRGALYSGAFLAIMAILGYVVTPWAVLCWPAAILISLAFAVGRHGRHHLHADLAGLRHGLARLHPPLPVLRHLLPADRLPGLAPGGRPRARPSTRASCCVRAADLGIFAWTLLVHIAYLRGHGGGGRHRSPDAVSARSCCRNAPPRTAGTVRAAFSRLPEDRTQ